MSNDIFKDLAVHLDPSGVLATAVENPDALRTTGNSINLAVGQRVKFRATLKDVSYDAYATLHSAHLHRLSLIDHTTRKGHSSSLVTGIMKPVKMDIDIVIGGELISIQEFLRRLSMAQSNKTVSPEEFAVTLENTGLRFDSGMPVFFQHFGCNIDEFNKLRDFFVNAGAQNVFGKIAVEKRGNIKEAYQMPMLNERAAMLGPSVVSFEVNRADRTQSQTHQPEQGLYGQGFIDFVDAVFNNYMRVVDQRKAATILAADNEARAMAENWSSDRRKAAEDQVKQLRKLSSDWTSNWSGSQRRVLVNPKDSTDVTVTDIYDPTQMDCGKISLANGPEVSSFNLWTDNRNRSLVSSTVEETFASSEGEMTPVEWN